MNDLIFKLDKKSPNFNKMKEKTKTYNFGIWILEFKTLLFIREKKQKGEMI